RSPHPPPPPLGLVFIPGDRRQGRRMTAPTGDQLKLFGMETVEGYIPDAPWRAIADRAIRSLAATGEPFNAEDVCAIAGRPDKPNAVGARISAHAKAGHIVRC